MGKTTKTKKVSYKPPVQALVKRQAAILAKDVEKVQRVALERRAVRMVVRGQSYDKVAQRLGISNDEAFKIVKENTARWLNEQTLDATSARELELKRLDAVLELAMYEAFPHPMRDDLGQVVMVRTCNCPLAENNSARACMFESHNVQAMTRPDRAWADMALDVSKRRASLLGLDAAAKLEDRKVQLLERVYTGVDADTIAKL